MEFLEAAEAMEVDQPMMLVAEVMHLPMDTGQPGIPVGTFQPELMGLGYTLSLIGSMDTPTSPIMDVDNALLDVTDPGAQAPETSKGPRSWETGGFTKSGIPLKKTGMTLWEKEATSHLK